MIASVISQAARILPIQVQRRVRGAEAGRRHRNLLLPLIALAALAASAAPALAAPTFGITMEHHNAYGLQAGECPGGHESLPGEPDCGVDPYTGSGTTFAQESGFNAYTIKVKNTSSGGLGAGATLKCESGAWEAEEAGGPTFGYHWLRNGTLIPGADEAEYTVTAEDEGKALQCQVAATNATASANDLTKAAVVEPLPATEPPASTALPTVTRESATVLVGTELACTPGTWTGSPTFGYQWLRNGVAIAGATTANYVTTAEDTGTALQCQVTGANVGGAVAADNTYFIYVGEAEPSKYPPYNTSEPTIPSSSEISGPVTVADRLPAGLLLSTTGATPELTGPGWECTVAAGGTGYSCTREKTPLSPGAEYPAITARVRVGDEASVGTPPSGGVVNTVAVSGGGAPTAIAHDATTISPAVPFGIQSLVTSVTDGMGTPFTQAAGHPAEATAVFEFNSTVDNLGDTVTAGGTPKNIETELPPGFIGDPQSAPKCTSAQASEKISEEEPGGVEGERLGCPAATAVGFVTVQLSSEPGSIHGGASVSFPPGQLETYLVFNLTPSPGTAASLAFLDNAFFALNARLRSDGDYGITIGDESSGSLGSHGVQGLSLTLCSYGVTGHGNEGLDVNIPATLACGQATADAKPFLTNSAQCAGSAPATTLLADTYEQPANYVSKTVYNGANLTDALPSAAESFLTGCSGLRFQPEVEFKPSTTSAGGTTQADEPTGATFALRVPQTNEAGTNATPELKNATVTLPEGMTVDPSAASGLQACSNAQFGLGATTEPAEPAACPPASQIGTAKITTPLLEKPLEGQVFLGAPECSPCGTTDAEDGRIFRLFLQVRLPERGVIVKVAGKVSANPTTGRLQATFTGQPQLPFDELLLTFNGGPRAPLANPQSCATATTTTDLTPWSTAGLGGLSGSEPIAGTPDATPSSSFAVDSDGQGGACSGMGFSPSFTAGSQTSAAAAASPFSVTLGREDREQDISGVTVTTPAGLLGKVSAVSQCPEAQANAGTCGAESLIGSTTVGAGPGADPFYLGGKVYLTGPYKGQPFGLSIVVPAIAGPFNLGTVVVRAAIAVNPSTAALTITTDALPQYVDGVQLRLRKINVDVNRPGFMLNPTSCAEQSVAATITAAQGASSSLSTPFALGGCSALAFAPKLSATSEAKASKAKGASLNVSIKSAPGEANIGKVDLQLPKAFPSRDSTLKQACTDAQFNSNPADCPEGSNIGTATANTPILNAPLAGPAYLVSHGNAAFPDVEFVLQGQGVTIVLDGKTDIKNGVTYSRFESVPDAPISSFESSFPEGPHSILAANLPASAKYSLCGQSLQMPTIITAQNGKQLKQTTKIAVVGCKASKPVTRAQKLKTALTQCRRDKQKKKRATCETRARKRYGPLKKARKSAKKSAKAKGSK